MAFVKYYDISSLSEEAFNHYSKADYNDWHRMLASFTNCIDRKERKKLNFAGKKMAKNQLVALRLPSGTSKIVSQPVKKGFRRRQAQVEPARCYVAFCAADEEINFVCSEVKMADEEEEEGEKNREKRAHIKIFTIDNEQQATFILPLRVQRDVTVIQKNNTSVRVLMIGPYDVLDDKMVQETYQKRIIDQEKEVIELQVKTALEITTNVKDLGRDSSVYISFTPSAETRTAAPGVRPGRELNKSIFPSPSPNPPLEQAEHLYTKYVDTRTINTKEFNHYLTIDTHDCNDLMSNHREEHRVRFVYPFCSRQKLHEDSMTTTRLNKNASRLEQIVSCRTVTEGDIPREVVVAPGRVYYAICSPNEVIRFSCTKEDSGKMRKEAIIRIITLNDQRLQSFVVPFRVQREVTLVVSNGTTVRVVIYPPTRSDAEITVPFNYKEVLVTDQSFTVETKEYDAFKIVAEVPGVDHDSTTSVYVTFTPSGEERKRLAAIADGVEPGEIIDSWETSGSPGDGTSREERAKPSSFQKKTWYKDVMYTYMRFDQLNKKQFELLMEAWNGECRDFFTTHRLEHKIEVYKQVRQYLQPDSVATIRLQSHVAKLLTCRAAPKNLVPREVVVRPGRLYFVICSPAEVILVKCKEEVCNDATSGQRNSYLLSREAVVRIIAISDEKLKTWAIPLRVQREVTVVQRNGTISRVVIYPPMRSDNETLVGINYAKRFIRHEHEIIETKEFDAFELRAAVVGSDFNLSSSVYIKFTPSSAERQRLTTVASGALSSLISTPPDDMTTVSRSAQPLSPLRRRFRPNTITPAVSSSQAPILSPPLTVTGVNDSDQQFEDEWTRSLAVLHEKQDEEMNLTQDQLMNETETCLRKSPNQRRKEKRSVRSRRLSGNEKTSRKKKKSPAVTTTNGGYQYNQAFEDDQAINASVGQEQMQSTTDVESRDLEKIASGSFSSLTPDDDATTISRSDQRLSPILKRFPPIRTATPAATGGLATLASGISSSPSHIPPDVTQRVSRRKQPLSPLRRRFRQSKVKTNVSTTEAPIPWTRTDELQQMLPPDEALNLPQDQLRNERQDVSRKSKRIRKQKESVKRQRRPRKQETTLGKQKSSGTTTTTDSGSKFNQAFEDEWARICAEVNQEEQDDMESFIKSLPENQEPSGACTQNNKAKAPTRRKAHVSTKTSKRTKSTRKSISPINDDQPRVAKSQKRKKKKDEDERRDVQSGTDNVVTRRRSQRSKVKSKLRQQNEQVRQSALNPRQFMAEKKSQLREKRKSKVDREIERSRASIVNPRQFHVQQMQLEHLHSLPSSSITHIEGYSQPSEAREQPQELTEEEELLQALDTIDNMRKEMETPKSPGDKQQ